MIATMPKPAPIIARLKRHRENLGLTQQAFADRLKINVGSLRNMEQGSNQPSKLLAAFIRGYLDFAEKA